MLHRSVALARAKRWTWAIAAAVPALGCVGAAVALASAAPDSGDQELELADVTPGPADCVLVGYSAAKGVGLRCPTDRASEALSTECGACGAGVVTLVESGATAAWARAAMCRAEDGDRTGPSIFWGGVNDDYLSWTADRDSPLDMFGFVAGLGGIGLDPPDDAADDRSLREDAARASLRRIEAQRRETDALFECMTRGDGPSLFAEHFVIQDLVHPIDDARTEMRSMRRSAARGHGLRVLSLLDASRTEAGVSWFADEVHPSQVGHHEIATRICAALER